jgi:hypothetical protein
MGVDVCGGADIRMAGEHLRGLEIAGSAQEVVFQATFLSGCCSVISVVH